MRHTRPRRAGCAASWTPLEGAGGSSPREPANGPGYGRRAASRAPRNWTTRLPARTPRCTACGNDSRRDKPTARAPSARLTTRTSHSASIHRSRSAGRGCRSRPRAVRRAAGHPPRPAGDRVGPPRPRRAGQRALPRRHHQTVPSQAGPSRSPSGVTWMIAEPVVAVGNCRNRVVSTPAAASAARSSSPTGRHRRLPPARLGRQGEQPRSPG